MNLFDATDRLEKSRRWRKENPNPSVDHWGIEAATGFVPVVGDLQDAAMFGQAVNNRDWKGAAIGAAAAALPFVSAPLINRGLAALERRVGPVGDVPADPNALMGAATQAASPGGGQAQIFLGETARNADLDALERAKEMAAQGASAEDIWRATAPSDPADPRTGWWVPTQGGPQPPGGAPMFELTEPPNLRLRQRPDADEAVLGAAQLQRDRAAAALHMRSLMQRDGVSAEQAALKLFDAGKYASAGVDEETIKMAGSMTDTALNQVLNDAKAQASKIVYKNYPLRELMDYPDLYQAMPEVADIPTHVKQMPFGEGGYYADKFDPGGERIVLSEDYSDKAPPLAGLSPAPSHRAVIGIHETGHAVQGNTPGFPRGGSPSRAPERTKKAISDAEFQLKLAERKAKEAQGKLGVFSLAQKMRDAGVAPNTPLPVLAERFPGQNPAVLFQASKESVRPDLDEVVVAASAEVEAALSAQAGPYAALKARRKVATMEPYDQYKRLEGEAASRMIERRAGLPVTVRRDRPAWLDADVPLNELIP